MAQSINALNSAMFSFSQMKTMQSVKSQIEGRNGVLEAEIESGNGNIEKKKEEMAENVEKSNQLTNNLYKNMANINQKLDEANDPDKTEKASDKKNVEEVSGTEKAGDQELTAEQGAESTDSITSGVELSDVAAVEAVTYNASGQVSSGAATVGAVINLAV